MNLFRFSKPLMIAVAISSLVACAESPMNSTAQASASDEKIAALQSDMKTLNANVADMKKTVDAMYKLITAKIQQNAPKPPVTSLELGTYPTLGDHSAKVAIVEYSDYQCPFCGAFEKRTIEETIYRYRQGAIHLPGFSPRVSPPCRRRGDCRELRRRTACLLADAR